MSMTGFGSASISTNGQTVSVEARAVNSRFLDLKIKLPLELEFMEGEIRKRVQSECIRGRVMLTVVAEINSSKKNDWVRFDRDRFETYISILDTIEKDYQRKIDIEDVININELVLDKIRTEVDTKTVMKGIDEALRNLVTMRRDEGEAITKDLTNRLDRLDDILDTIRMLAKQSFPKTKSEYQSKLREMTGNIDVDDIRIIQEAAILAEKADVTEECVRCTSHLKQLRKMLESNQPVGKRMNFLLQEVNREVNTIGSKTNQLEITNLVIDMKEGTEQIKEQVQNVL